MGERMLQRAGAHRLVPSPVNAAQETLTEQLIVPHLKRIFEDLDDLRNAVDYETGRYFVQRFGSFLQHSDSIPSVYDGVFDPSIVAQAVGERFGGLSKEKLENYPIGWCWDITVLVQRLMKNDTLTGGRSGLSRLEEFIRQGGIFKMIWGGMRNVYFQTAFQVGSHYIDVANNTVSVTAKKVTGSSLGESGFNSILTYADYIPIRSSYHGVDLYLNTCLPALMPYFPLLAVSKASGHCCLDTSLYMARRNIMTRFRTVKDLLETDHSVQIPHHSVLESLGKSVRAMKGGESQDWMAFRIMEPAEMIRILEEQAEMFDGPRHVRRTKTAVKMARAINGVWDIRGIRADLLGLSD